MDSFKMGDKVKVKDDLSYDKVYSCGLCEDMLDLRGAVVTIRGIDQSDNTYQLLEDDNNFWWSRDMFEDKVEIVESTAVEAVSPKKRATRKSSTTSKKKSGGLEEVIVEAVIPILIDRVKVDSKELLKGITTVVVNLDKKKIKETTLHTHKQFEKVLTLVSNKIPAMLTGPAGSGKTGTCEKIAECLNLDYYFSNAITQEYKLTGFIDANGKYQETQFYKAFKNGGLFVLDEIDASVPEALIILNTAIANGYFDFPNGRVKAHDNFRIVACANTYGLGSDDIYVGRYQLDGASLDRFAIVEFEYDDALEKSLVENQEWAEFIQKLRKKIKEKKLRHVLSMRATIYGDKLLKTDTPLEEIFKQVVFKNLKVDDIKVLGHLSGSNNFISGFNSFIDSNCTTASLI